MEALAEHYGIAGIVALLALRLVVELLKLLWSLWKKKERGNDQHLATIELTMTQVRNNMQELKIKMELVERELAELNKLRNDVQKVFSAVKYLAGPRWPDVRKKIAQDNLP